MRATAFVIGLIGIAIWLWSALTFSYDDRALIGDSTIPGSRWLYGAVGAALIIGASWPWVRGVARLLNIGLKKLRDFGDRTKP